MKPAKILVLGATGAMARYMIPFLAENGCQVDGIALDGTESGYPNVKYYQGNAKDSALRKEYLSRNYDAIVDYLTYGTSEIPFILPQMLEHTGMKQSELMPLYDGLKMEIDRTPRDYPWPNNQRMDDYLAAMK
ncbi:MAG: hypothetical protein IJJ33_14625 [Victivallales bacterium]|nr:hypothetical protein [Victivallales bacterium]